MHLVSSEPKLTSLVADSDSEEESNSEDEDDSEPSPNLALVPLDQPNDVADDDDAEPHWIIRSVNRIKRSLGFEAGQDATKKIKTKRKRSEAHEGEDVPKPKKHKKTKKHDKKLVGLVPVNDTKKVIRQAERA